MSPLQLGTEVVVTIDKMAVGGAGLGRHENLVIFVPFAAPGDIVEVKITDVKKNFVQGEIKRIITPSPARVKPRCIHFGECGGCQWQHLAHDEQLKQKQTILQDLVNKFLPSLRLTVPEVIKSPAFYNYRNRSQPKKEVKVVGFNRRKSSEIIDIQECHLLEDPLANKWLDLKKEISSDAKLQGRSEIYIDQNNETNWRWIEDLHEDLLFSQVNRFQNADLVATVQNLISEKPAKNFLELYAGSGNFTFPIYKSHFKKADGLCTAVEKIPALVLQAQDKMRAEKISHARLQYLCVDVDDFVQRANISGYELVLVDPPRAGLSEKVIGAIIAARPKRLIYISCHPVSLCRDLQMITNRHADYRVSYLQSYEMFPQTDHFETVIELIID